MIQRKVSYSDYGSNWKAVADASRKPENAVSYVRGDRSTAGTIFQIHSSRMIVNSYNELVGYYTDSSIDYW